MISYEPPKQEAFGVGDYIDGIGTVLDPDDEEMVAFMEGAGTKDDTDYIKGSDEPHAHLNSCGTGELTVFIDPSKVKTLTLMGDEVKHYDLVEKPTSEQRCSFLDSAKLLPCPFCGGEAELFRDPSHRDIAGNIVPRKYGVRCMRGGMIVQTVLVETRADAIAVWNRRA